MNLLRMMFCEIETGSLRRLPFFGCKVLLMIAAYINQNVSFFKLSVALYVMLFIMLAYVEFVLVTKRMRNIGFQNSALFSSIIIILAIVVNFISEALINISPGLLIFIFLLSLGFGLFLLFAPEGSIGKQAEA